MKVNGQRYTKNYLEHFEMQKGGTIDIEMSNQPNTQRGTSDADVPYSFTTQK